MKRQDDIRFNEQFSFLIETGKSTREVLVANGIQPPPNLKFSGAALAFLEANFSRVASRATIEFDTKTYEMKRKTNDINDIVKSRTSDDRTVRIINISTVAEARQTEESLSVLFKIATLQRQKLEDEEERRVINAIK